MALKWLIMFKSMQIFTLPAAEDTSDAQLYWILMMRLVSLPLSHRMVFNLNVIDGYSLLEVTRLCGRGLEVVKHYLSEARLMLRESDLGY